MSAVFKLDRYDLELCDGESGRCDAKLARNSRGDWVYYEDAKYIIQDLEEEVYELRRRVRELEVEVDDLQDQLQDERE